MQACPKACISMKRDAEGFLYPHANAEICIECGLCEKVCPCLNLKESKQPLAIYAAINPDEEIRKKSSSGGVFWLLVERTIKDGGVVFGAAFDKNWMVNHSSAETLEKAKKFQGSKYVQSRMNGCYKEAHEALKQGRKVLFTGTPCQIAGLNLFLRKPYENLLTAEIVCHGVPSPMVWSLFLTKVVSEGSDIMYYDQSSKLVKILLPRQKNLYMKTYLSEIISRPSCYNCPVKGGRSCADITLADFWGIENVEPTVNDDKGTSMVLVHTVKGLASLPLENLNFKETNQSVLKYNTSYIKSSTANPKRENFFSALETTDDLHQLMEDTLRPTIKEQIETLKHPLYLSKRMVKMIIKPVLNTAPRPSGGGVFIKKTI